MIKTHNASQTARSHFIFGFQKNTLYINLSCGYSLKHDTEFPQPADESTIDRLFKPAYRIRSSFRLPDCFGLHDTVRISNVRFARAFHRSRDSGSIPAILVFISCRNRNSCAVHATRKHDRTLCIRKDTITGDPVFHRLPYRLYGRDISPLHSTVQFMERLFRVPYFHRQACLCGKNPFWHELSLISNFLI